MGVRNDSDSRERMRVETSGTANARIHRTLSAEFRQPEEDVGLDARG